MNEAYLVWSEVLGSLYRWLTGYVPETACCVVPDAGTGKTDPTTVTAKGRLQISKLKANWIGHPLCRNCLLRQVIEGKIKWGIEVTGRRGRKHRKLLDNLEERRGYSHLKEEALDRTMWTARFGRGFGHVVRQTARWMRRRRKVDSNIVTPKKVM
jgi:hypothetical protein